MLKTTDLILFAKTLGGIYDNLEQSQANPKEFARINIFFVPSHCVFEGPGFTPNNVMTMHPGIHTGKGYTV